MTEHSGVGGLIGMAVGLTIADRILRKRKRKKKKLNSYIDKETRI